MDTRHKSLMIERVNYERKGFLDVFESIVFMISVNTRVPTSEDPPDSVPRPEPQTACTRPNEAQSPNSAGQ